MREHIEDNWPLYGVAFCILVLILLLVVAFAEKQRRAEVCFDRGMVVVETPAGGRCVAPAALERI
jgi:hypothetical protein